jgi:hypothetical protein
MAHKKEGDRLKQRLLDESKRIPPSRGLMEVELQDIGHPDPKLTAKILDDNDISLIPVEKPSRKSRARAKPAPQPPPATALEAPTAPTISWSTWVRMRAAHFGRDTLYAIAIHGARYLISIAAFSIITGGSFFAFLEYDLKEKVDKFIKGTQGRIEVKLQPPPEPPQIETGSVERLEPTPPAIKQEALPAPAPRPMPSWSYELHSEPSTLAPVSE